MHSLVEEWWLAAALTNIHGRSKSTYLSWPVAAAQCQQRPSVAGGEALPQRQYILWAENTGEESHQCFVTVDRYNLEAAGIDIGILCGIILSWQ
jgi:hypothetical protein